MKLATIGGVTGVITEAKNTSGSALSTPSATPALVKERMRPLTKTMNCVGPAVPIESGGKAPVSVSVAPLKERAVVWTCSVIGTSAFPSAGG